MSVRNKADMLQGKLRYTDGLVQAIRIFLYLSCDRLAVTSPADLTMLASDLKDILSKPDTRLCSSFEFTLWQLFVGSMATTADSETGVWFRTTFWRMARTLGFEGVEWGIGYFGKSFYASVGRFQTGLGG
ncbi:hypothetical protein F66182_13237, partial [Fusarium sp. NRRL 66182]